MLEMNDDEKFYDETKRMLDENAFGDNESRFFITTKNQPSNSHDLLNPWDKYTQEELFPNGEDDREAFNLCCAKTLNPLRTRNMRGRTL